MLRSFLARTSSHQWLNRLPLRLLLSVLHSLIPSIITRWQMMWVVAVLCRDESGDMMHQINHLKRRDDDP
jgi:hypothetical protein